MILLWRFAASRAKRPMTISGRVVLITGASEGIGAACAEAFRSRGARLSLTARNAGRLSQVGGPGVVFTAGDLTRAEIREQAIQRTLDAYGRLDILINNAGCGLYGPSWSNSPVEVAKLWELNVLAPLALTQLAVPIMQRQGSGMVVNVGSIAGKVTLPWMTVYSASKAALGALTAGLRMELASSKIHTMTVCPGYVQTGFQQHALSGGPPAAVRSARRFAITPERCAADIVRGVERNARTVVTPWVCWFMVAAERMLPRLVHQRMAALLSDGDVR